MSKKRWSSGRRTVNKVDCSPNIASERVHKLWSVPETRKLWLHRRAEKGFGRDQLLEMQKVFDTEKSDINDVLAFVVYALTRQERAVHAS